MIPFISSRLAEEETNKSEFIILFMVHSYGFLITLCHSYTDTFELFNKKLVNVYLNMEYTTQKPSIHT